MVKKKRAGVRLCPISFPRLHSSLHPVCNRAGGIYHRHVVITAICPDCHRVLKGLSVFSRPPTSAPSRLPMAAAAAVPVGVYLVEHKVKHISWHIILNNHASTRPKMYGGKIVDSVTACKEYKAPGSASAEWECTVSLPHSFVNGDGLRLVTTGRGSSRDEASEVACLEAVATLIVQNPSEFVLRPKHWHWTVNPSELLAGLPCADAGHQALPVHVPARLRGAGAEAGTPEADARLVELVSQ